MSNTVNEFVEWVMYFCGAYLIINGAITRWKR